MGLSYNTAIAALLNNGEKQVLPVSMSNLIELADDKSNFGTNAQSVQDALTYLAGAFNHANTVAKNEADRAESNSYTYVGLEINKLDVDAVGSTTKDAHNKYISYIWEKDGKIEAFAQDMSAANVAYSGGDGRATVAAELQHINKTIAENLEDTTLHLVSVTGTGNEETETAATTVAADGSVYRLKQGEQTVATFNIEKDSFVKTGAVVRGTLSGSTFTPGDEQNPGTYYIKLEIRTQDDNGTGTGTVEHTLYIPAESLVDAYTANNSGTVQSSEDGTNNVTIHVDTTANTISAVIKAGGVGTTELADSAVTTAKIADSNVTTAKIADENVTLGKLASGVQTSLGLADSAVQSIAEGATHGTISVDGSDVAVNLTGLADVATSGAASDVSITTNADLDLIAGYSGNTHVDDVQEALEKLAVKVKQINDGSVTSVQTSVVDNGKDANSLVNISMTPTSSAKGDVTVALTHNLGGVAVLDYESKNTSSAISETFYNGIQ